SCELRNQRDTSKLLTLVWFLDLKFLCEHFKSTTRGGLRPAAITCLPARTRGAKAALRLPRPANAHCWERRARRAGATPPSRPPAPRGGKIGCADTLSGTLRDGLAVNWSPRGQLFSLFINSTYRGFGDHFLGLGITRFRLAWKVRALTRCRPGEGCMRAGSSGTSPS